MDLNECESSTGYFKEPKDLATILLDAGKYPSSSESEEEEPAGKESKAMGRKIIPK